MAGQRHASLVHLHGSLIWTVSFYREGKRLFKSTGTSNEKLAEAERRKYEREMFDGTEGMEAEVIKALHDPRRRDAVLNALAVATPISPAKSFEEYETFCAGYKQEKTLYNDLRQIKRTLDSTGANTLDVVTSGMLSEHVAREVTKKEAVVTCNGKRWRVKPWGPSSVKRWRETLHHFFGWAFDNGYHSSNPVDGVRCPDQPDVVVSYLSVDDIKAVFKAVAGDLIEPIVAMAIYGGLRRSELTWLTLDGDVIPERKTILVRRKTVGGKLWVPKTKKNRPVKFEPRLLPFLERRELRVGKGPWYFLSPKGTRWNPDNLSHRLSRLMKAAGLNWTFQDFRHTFGSSLAIAGYSLFQIAELMGNSERVCKKHYIGLINDTIDVDFARAPQRTAL